MIPPLRYYVIGAILMSAAQNLDTLFVGRLFAGIGACECPQGPLAIVTHVEPQTRCTFVCGGRLTSDGAHSRS